MNKFFASFAGVVAALAISGSTVAADWAPSGPIKMMIAFAAGGGADTQARLIAEELQKRHGWEIIPEQVTGGGGAKMAAALKGQPNDGTAIGLAITETFGYNMVANPSAGYTQADFTPLTTTAGFQMGVVSLSSKGWGDINDAFAAAKAGETLRFGTMSPRLSDLAFLLGEANGVDFNIVEVKGGKAVMNGVNAGDMDLGFMAGIQAKGVAAGDLVNLASALAVPLNQTPSAPTLADLGVPFDGNGMFLFTAPAGLPNDAREAITNAIVEIITDADTKPAALINRAFGGPSILTGAELEAQLASDVAGAEGLLAAVQ